MDMTPNVSTICVYRASLYSQMASSPCCLARITYAKAVGRFMTDLIAGGDRTKKAIEEVKSVSPGRFMS